jgi:hypothetical protein
MIEIVLIVGLVILSRRLRRAVREPRRLDIHIHVRVDSSTVRLVLV